MIANLKVPPARPTYTAFDPTRPIDGYIVEVKWPGHAMPTETPYPTDERHLAMQYAKDMARAGADVTFVTVQLEDISDVIEPELECCEVCGDLLVNCPNYRGRA